MKAYFAGDGPRLQVVCQAEDDKERLLIGVFVEQLKDKGIVLHGYGGKGERPGHDNFNFGSPSKSPEAKEPPVTTDRDETRGDNECA